MKSNFRQFFVLNCDVETTKRGAILPDMRTLMTVWRSHWQAGTAKTKIRNKEATLVIGDIVIDEPNQCATMLIRLSDTMAPESVYSDIDADKFTAHPNLSYS